MKNNKRNNNSSAKPGMTPIHFHTEGWYLLKDKAGVSLSNNPAHIPLPAPTPQQTPHASTHNGASALLLGLTFTSVGKHDETRKNNSEIDMASIYQDYC